MRILKIALAAVALSLACTAQDTPTEPQFDNVFFRLDAGKLIPLEVETATIQGKAGGFFVATAKALWEVPGSKSPTRFAANQPLEFVVRSSLAATNADPSTFFFLRKMDSKKKTREIVYMTGHFSPVGGSSQTNLMEGVLQVTFAHFGKESIKITTAPLPPGEYALSAFYGQTLYCFGLD